MANMSSDMQPFFQLQDRQPVCVSHLLTHNVKYITMFVLMTYVFEFHVSRCAFVVLKWLFKVLKACELSTLVLTSMDREVIFLLLHRSIQWLFFFSFFFACRLTMI